MSKEMCSDVLRTEGRSMFYAGGRKNCLPLSPVEAACGTSGVSASFALSSLCRGLLLAGGSPSAGPGRTAPMQKGFLELG